MNWLIILIISVQLGLAQERQTALVSDLREDIISDDYQAGAFLIYNCEKKHWVCVLENYYKECQDQRAQDNKNRGTFHTCAPIGKFPSKKSCFQRVLYLTSHNHGDRFCLKDQWKEKGIE